MVIATPERPAVQPFSPPRFSEASGPMLDARIPSGPLTEKWDLRKFENKLVAPANRRKFKIIVVGTGLAGASAAASLGEQGYDVQAFCIHDSPRRAHSIAAQGASTQRRTTRMMAIRSTASSTTRSRAATTEHVKAMCTASRK